MKGAKVPIDPIQFARNLRRSRNDGMSNALSVEPHATELASTPSREARPGWMRFQETERLLATVTGDIRTLTVYTLAMHVGLTCREIAGLGVTDVAPDGREPGDAILCHPVDGRRAHHEHRALPVPPDVRPILAPYLTWRRGLCPHPDRPMKTTMGRDRIRRCASCGDVADFLRAPLFLSQWMRRISPRRLRAEFAEYRDAAGLRKSLHFDCMRATFLHEQKLR